MHSEERHSKLTVFTITYLEKEKKEKRLIKENSIKVYVQGDDFFILQTKEELERYNEDAELKKSFQQIQKNSLEWYIDLRVKK
jgi:hypothetical protein